MRSDIRDIVRRSYVEPEPRSEGGRVGGPGGARGGIFVVGSPPDHKTRAGRRRGGW